MILSPYISTVNYPFGMQKKKNYSFVIKGRKGGRHYPMKKRGLYMFCPRLVELKAVFYCFVFILPLCVCLQLAIKLTMVNKSKV